MLRLPRRFLFACSPVRRCPPRDAAPVLCHASCLMPGLMLNAGVSRAAVAAPRTRAHWLRFSSDTCQPCASAICRHSASPMPVPPGLVVKNGTNTSAPAVTPRPPIQDADFHVARVLDVPLHLRKPAGFLRRIEGVANQVDEQLLELIGIGADHHVGAGDHLSAAATAAAPRPARRRGRWPRPGWSATAASRAWHSRAGTGSGTRPVTR